MVLLFQIFFFTIVIVSSFFGLKTFFTVVTISLLFTLVNVYTLPLLILQSSVIICTGIIGLVIATFVSICKGIEDLPEIREKIRERLSFYKSKTKKEKKQDINFICFIILCIIIFLLLHKHIPNMSDGFLLSFFNFIFFLLKLILTFTIPGLIAVIFDFENGGLGILILYILAIIVFWFL